MERQLNRRGFPILAAAAGQPAGHSTYIGLKCPSKTAMRVGKRGPTTSPAKTTMATAARWPRLNTTAAHTPIHASESTRIGVASLPFSKA